jgi:heme/copper-type cytochrome/quinol oxidase subunit 2
MADISKNILQKIKKDEVRPYPKQYFLLKRSVIWTVFGLLILLGSVAGAIVLFQLRYAEWDLYKHLSHSLAEFVLLVIPFFWLIFLLGFTVFAYYYFRRTEHGYRYAAIWIILLSIALSIIGGGLLYSTGCSERLERVFQENLPFYRELQERKQKVWMSPMHGLLAGRIIKIISDQKVEIEDLQGNNWTIDIADTIWRGRLRPAENLKIKILGEMTGQNRFVANEIRPWKGRRGRRK